MSQFTCNNTVWVNFHEWFVVQRWPNLVCLTAQEWHRVRGIDRRFLTIIGNVGVLLLSRFLAKPYRTGLQNSYNCEPRKQNQSDPSIGTMDAGQYLHFPLMSGLISSKLDEKSSLVMVSGLTLFQYFHISKFWYNYSFELIVIVKQR